MQDTRFFPLFSQALLIRRTKAELQKWNESLSAVKMPDDATELSYWVTQNLPLDDSLRLHLLSINNSIQRLRCALSMILKVRHIHEPCHENTCLCG